MTDCLETTKEQLPPPLVSKFVQANTDYEAAISAMITDKTDANGELYNAYLTALDSLLTTPALTPEHAQRKLMVFENEVFDINGGDWLDNRHLLWFASIRCDMINAFNQ